MEFGEEDASRQPIVRADGVTPADRYLQKLCENAFLRLWSYPGVYRDQGKAGNQGDGKEVCDLLVVFENHIIIFSDKSCVFPDSGDIERDWARWYRRAVLASARQVWGAERWIRDIPKRLFLDRACTRPFPFPLPDPEKAVFHRIVVAHNSAIRSRRHFGGSGSLMIMPDIIGDQHTLSVAKGGMPFAVGHIDPTRGFVHVLDDVSMDVLLKTLDTISDFVGYLAKKEALIASGKLGAATGEEDLLAFYLWNLNDDREHDFVIPDHVDKISIDELFWVSFRTSPQRHAQIEADRVSYMWDALIEEFGKNILGGTLYHGADHDIGYHEPGLRFLAREPRLVRRNLSKALAGVLERATSSGLAARVVAPNSAKEPLYVFLSVANRHGMPDCDFRSARVGILTAYCKVAKLLHPDADYVLGIGTEPLGCGGRSEDLICIDARGWTDEDFEEARQIQNETGILKNTAMTKVREHEFPVVGDTPGGLCLQPTAARRSAATNRALAGAVRNSKSAAELDPRKKYFASTSRMTLPFVVNFHRRVLAGLSVVDKTMGAPESH